MTPRILLALVPLTLLIAACGQDTSLSSATTPGGSAPAATAASPSTAANGCQQAASVQSGPDNFNDTVSLVDGPNGLRYGDFKTGTGPQPRSGQEVVVNYTGWLTNGTQFDSSRQAARSPFTFHLGAGEVISGWDLGVASMHLGGKRRLVIPAALGYGANGSPPVIPANATLVFDVELIGLC